jgi:hypothetical protein
MLNPNDSEARNVSDVLGAEPSPDAASKTRFRNATSFTGMNSDGRRHRSISVRDRNDHRPYRHDGICAAFGGRRRTTGTRDSRVRESRRRILTGIARKHGRRHPVRIPAATRTMS